MSKIWLLAFGVFALLCSGSAFAERANGGQAPAAVSRFSEKLKN